MPTAVLIDGGFFLKRFPRCYPGKDKNDPKIVAKTAFELALSHLEDKDDPEGRRRLYRIFFYDCPPVQKKAHRPMTRTSVDFGRTEVAQFRLMLHDELRRLRKVALRLGQLAGQGEWELKTESLKRLLKREIVFQDLKDDDFAYDVRQKGVDMRVGLDIASLVFKKQVDQIVLVSGDADFVPAAKLARREGIDFILDPMWNPVSDHLHEHVDGLRSTCPRPMPIQGDIHVQASATARQGPSKASKTSSN
ncbi:MAG: NYN domain-containing protein [Acidobacteriaceae bacterium]